MDKMEAKGQPQSVTHKSPDKTGIIQKIGQAEDGEYSYLGKAMNQTWSRTYAAGQIGPALQ